MKICTSSISSALSSLLSLIKRPWLVKSWFNQAWDERPIMESIYHEKTNIYSLIYSFRTVIYLHTYMWWQIRLCHFVFIKSTALKIFVRKNRRSQILLSMTSDIDILFFFALPLKLTESAHFTLSLTVAIENIDLEKKQINARFWINARDTLFPHDFEISKIYRSI